MYDFRRLVVGICFAFSLGACGTSSEPESSRDAWLATFNAGLAPGDVEYADQRQPVVIAELGKAASQLELLCVQEFFRQADYDALVTATASELPNTHRMPPKPGPTCMKEDETGLANLKTCMLADCADAVGELRVTCALSSCGAELGQISDQCTVCLTQDLTAPIDVLFSLCSPTETTAPSGSTAALYGGAFDVGLFSRTAWLDQASQELPAFMIRVGVLYGKIASNAGDLDVFCTHLTSDLPFDYKGEFGTYKHENKAEIEQLLAFVNEKTTETSHVVLLGDLNCGPAIGSIEGEWPDNYGLLTDAGFVDPFVAESNVACTSCPDNTLRSDDSRATLIDHVLVRGFQGRVHVERLFTEPAEIQGDDGPTTSSLSDHYGLRARLRH